MRQIDFSDSFTSATPSTAETTPASDITNTPSGNLAATNVQAALNELQSDIDTRALDSDLDAVETALLAEIALKADDADLTSHTGNTSNPHSVTKAQVGLSNVDNTSDAAKNAAAVALTNKTIDADSNTITNIENAEIKAGAAIDLSKLAPTTVNRVLVSDGSGVISPSIITTTDLGYLGGLSQDIQDSLDELVTKSVYSAKGTIAVADGPSTPQPLAVGPDGYTIVADSAETFGVKWAPSAGSSPAPTIQKFTSGSGNYNKNYAFGISSGSATVGATYTNNGITFTVYATVASATLVHMTGNGAPTTSGTLTKASGTGDATLTFTAVTTPKYLRVRMVGGGGGGGASGSGAATASTGGNSTFGSSLLTANGGVGGGSIGPVGSGGTATVTTSGTVLQLVALQGGYGHPGAQNPVLCVGGNGASSPFGGGGAGGYGSGASGIAGNGGIANSGAGGGGAGAGSTTAISGAGGGAGGYLEALIITPSSTYAYAVGSGGAGSAAGTNGSSGGGGGSGFIEVTEFYS